MGNWPGVTVEKKEGNYSYLGYKIKVVDLPGVYSLSAYSPDEVVARNFILQGKPDVVVDIVDASNLERNLYLTLQLIELEANLIIGLNMLDVAKSRGHQIDIGGLVQELGVPVVPMIANKKQGHNGLLQEIVNVFEGKTNNKRINLYYGSELEEHLKELEELIAKDEELSRQFPPRWLAIKLLEEDSEVLEKIGIKIE